MDKELISKPIIDVFYEIIKNKIKYYYVRLSIIIVGNRQDFFNIYKYKKEKCIELGID